jgi:hypothetical protein
MQWHKVQFYDRINNISRTVKVLATDSHRAGQEVKRMYGQHVVIEWAGR